MVMNAKPTQRDPDQTWFWTPTWQQREVEADDDIAAGNVERYNSDEAFLASFDPEADPR